MVQTRNRTYGRMLLGNEHQRKGGAGIYNDNVSPEIRAFEKYHAVEDLPFYFQKVPK